MSHVNNDFMDWFDLDAYFARRCDAEEQARIERWFGETPERQAQLQRLQSLWSARQRQPVRDFQRDDAIAQVLATIRVAEREAPTDIARPSKAKKPWIRFGATTVARYAFAGAAAVAMIVGLALGLHRWPADRGPVSVLSYTTGMGQRANITLPDGSTVVLNVASRLDVPSNYASGNRTVRLQGQAAFVARHHDSAPLTVMTGDVATRVLGTRFMVRSYATDTVTTVAVRDGRVAVEAGSARAVVIGKAQQVAIGAFGAPRVSESNGTPFEFESGALVLTSVPLRDAIADLNRWYDADIQVADSSLGDLKITGRLTSGSVTELATMLEMSFDVRVVRNNRVLTLYPR